MQQKRSVLYLNDPLDPNTHDKQGLVFAENESLLSQAQTALWQARKSSDWICVAVRGNAADIGLALAAQLPVDRLALLGASRQSIRLNREMNRLKTFARRNLALIASEILLVGTDEARARAILRGTGRCSICLLDALPESRLADSWDALCEKNLLIRGKCV